MSVHKAKKHQTISQLDGNVSLYDDDEDDAYEGSEHFWRNQYLGCAYQSYIDAMKTLESCKIDEPLKEDLKIAVLEARKSALGKDYKDFPPWSS